MQVRCLPGAPYIASVAQLVERLPEEQGVVGSSPTGGTKELSQADFLVLIGSEEELTGR